MHQKCLRSSNLSSSNLHRTPRTSFEENLAPVHQRYGSKTKPQDFEWESRYRINDAVIASLVPGAETGAQREIRILVSAVKLRNEHRLYMGMQHETAVTN